MGDPLMEMVRIYHPNLDDGRVVEVPADSLFHHLRGGWLKESDRPQSNEPKNLDTLPKAEDLGDDPKGVQPVTTKKEGK